MVVFLVFLSVTVVLFVGAVATGRGGRRRAHFSFAGAGVVLLGFTVYLAERLGEGYDLEAAGRITPVHLGIAKLTVGVLLLVLATGLLTVRRRANLRWHGPLAYLVFALMVVTLVTGTWMILAAERL